MELWQTMLPEVPSAIAAPEVLNALLVGEARGQLVFASGVAQQGARASSIACGNVPGRWRLAAMSTFAHSRSRDKRLCSPPCFLEGATQWHATFRTAHDGGPVSVVSLRDLDPRGRRCAASCRFLLFPQGREQARVSRWQFR